jgi:hypothetical protein
MTIMTLTVEVKNRNGGLVKGLQNHIDTLERVLNADVSMDDGLRIIDISSILSGLLADAKRQGV